LAGHEERRVGLRKRRHEVERHDPPAFQRLGAVQPASAATQADQPRFTTAAEQITKRSQPGRTLHGMLSGAELESSGKIGVLNPRGIQGIRREGQFLKFVSTLTQYSDASLQARHRAKPGAGPGVLSSNHSSSGTAERTGLLKT
jgi:hypothetical protein